MSHDAPAAHTSLEVYRSARREDCRERALVLDAVGIRCEMQLIFPYYLLVVDSPDAARAREQLALYERERQPAPAPPPRPSPFPQAWIGCLIYALLLVVIGLCVSNGLWGSGAFDAGALDAGAVQAGQWWRAWTALTLHLDGQHLAANLLVGIWFGYLGGRQQGPGHAWLLILNGAAASNLIEALLAPASHGAVGASTAVFTALGSISAYTWRTEARWAQHWALQWAPLVCGVVLLAWFGSGDSTNPGQVDVVAHALGFAMGVLLGVIAALPVLRRRLRRLPQWITGLVALAQLALAWGLALGH